jgi:hypothetical protein
MKILQNQDVNDDLHEIAYIATKLYIFNHEAKFAKLNVKVLI